MEPTGSPHPVQREQLSIAYTRRVAIDFPRKSREGNAILLAGEQPAFTSGGSPVSLLRPPMARSKSSATLILT